MVEGMSCRKLKTCTSTQSAGTTTMAPCIHDGCSKEEGRVYPYKQNAQDYADSGIGDKCLLGPVVDTGSECEGHSDDSSIFRIVAV